MSVRVAVAWVAIFVLLVAAGERLIGTEPPAAGPRSLDGSRLGPGDNGDTAETGESGDRTAIANDRRPAAKPIRVRALRAIDGDTILVRGGFPGSYGLPASKRTERVRYIGVDTPETVKPGTMPQCMGKRASDFNKSAVAGRDLRIVPDRELRDRYGRLLAYVYVGSRMINAALLENGLARTLVFPPNTRHARRFAALQRVAKRTNRGLWAACER